MTPQEVRKKLKTQKMKMIRIESTCWSGFVLGVVNIVTRAKGPGGLAISRGMAEKKVMS